jgi:copper transport protein
MAGDKIHLTDKGYDERAQWTIDQIVAGAAAADRRRMESARRYVGRIAGLIVAVVAVVDGDGGAASAHASLESSQPDSSAVLDKSPTEILLKFDEQVEVSLGGITLLDQKGAEIPVGAPEHVDGDPSRIRSSVPTLANGTYVVAWRVTSADSHPAEGAFSFVVVSGDQVDINALAQRAFGTNDGRVSPLLGAARFASYVGLAGLVGGLAFFVIVWPSGADSWPARRIVWFAWLILVIATALAFALEGPYAAGRTLGRVFDPALWRAVARTRYGTWLIVRLVVAILAAGLIATARRQHARAWRLATVAAAVLLALSFAMAGHAGTGRIAGLGVVLDMTHLLSMSVWLGGLALLVVGLRDEEKPPLGARFSALALGCVALLVTTGVVQSLRMAVTRHHLLVAWGRTYVIKLAGDHPRRRCHASRRTVRYFWPDVPGCAYRGNRSGPGCRGARRVGGAHRYGAHRRPRRRSPSPRRWWKATSSPTWRCRRQSSGRSTCTSRSGTTPARWRIASVDGRLTLEGSELGTLSRMVSAGPNRFMPTTSGPLPALEAQMLANDGSSTTRFDVNVKITCARVVLGGRGRESVLRRGADLGHRGDGVGPDRRSCGLPARVRVAFHRVGARDLNGRWRLAAGRHRPAAISWSKTVRRAAATSGLDQFEPPHLVDGSPDRRWCGSATEGGAVRRHFRLQSASG